MDNQKWGEIRGSETTAALQVWVRKCLLRIATAHPDQLVASVVFAGVISAAISLTNGAAPLAFLQAENGSISRLLMYETKLKYAATTASAIWINRPSKQLYPVPCGW